MTVRLLAFVTINEDQPAALASYLAATGPLLEKAGGKIVQRVAIDEVVVGNVLAKTMIVVEYPTRAAVSAVFDSDAYRAIVPLRDKAFRDYHVLIVAA